MEQERPAIALNRPPSLATLTDIMSELGSVSDIAEEVHAWSLAPETPDMSDRSSNGTETGTELAELREYTRDRSHSQGCSRDRSQDLDIISTQSRTDSVDGLSSRASAAQVQALHRQEEETLSETGSIECGASSVDWIGERITGTMSLSAREPMVQPNSGTEDSLRVSCDDTVLEFGMDTKMQEVNQENNDLDEQETIWPGEHHAFDAVAVFSWTLVSLASVARRHSAAGRRSRKQPPG